MSHNISVLILAAGQGTRMVSSLPKVLHPVGGVPMVKRVLRAAQGLRPAKVAFVIGHEGELLKKALAEEKADFVWQKTRQGSGHAVKQALSWIKTIARKSGHVMILSGDTPLIATETLKSLFQFHVRQKLAATVLTSNVPNPFGYGRMVRDPMYRLRRIVEEKDATPDEKRIAEINSGIYCIDAKLLAEALPLLRNDNAKKEYYLTDVIGYFYEKGYPMETFSHYTYDGASETLGVNSRVELAEAEQIFQKRILTGWMKKGVTIFNPSHTYVSEEARLAADVQLLPGTMILGNTKIGAGSVIGPNSHIEDSEIGENVKVRASFVAGAKIGNKVQVGPFSHLRKGTVLKEGAKVGNFSETKNAVIGFGAKVNHLSYVGDATLGEKVNVGAGTITCNYDGKNKHKTVIGANVFVGSNTNLVAPVTIGAGALIAAGSTITENVPADSLGLARSKQIVKKGWAKKNRP